MPTDGKQLENLVAFVEETMLPHGFEVNVNKKLYDDDGVQIAEFDIEVRGKLGTTQFAWLIECRDRPSEGAAPGAWIQQLAGRRQLYGFDRITAVSTTGFAPSAVDAAGKLNVELREVASLDAEAFADWLVMRHIRRQERMYRLEHAAIIIPEDETEERQEALRSILGGSSAGQPVLRTVKTGEMLTVANAFMNAATQLHGLWDDVQANSHKDLSFRARYSHVDHYVIDTELGPIRVDAIDFRGRIELKETLVLLTATAEYLHFGSGERISEVALFEPQVIHGMKLGVELHRLSNTGETHVLLRRHDSKNNPKD